MICWDLAACREFWSELYSLEGHSVTDFSVKQVQTWDIGSWCICKWQHTLNPYPRHLGCDNTHLLGGCTLHEWLHSDISSHLSHQITLLSQSGPPWINTLWLFMFPFTFNSIFSFNLFGACCESVWAQTLKRLEVSQHLPSAPELLHHSWFPSCPNKDLCSA